MTSRVTSQVLRILKDLERTGGARKDDNIRLGTMVQPEAFRWLQQMVGPDLVVVGPPRGDDGVFLDACDSYDGFVVDPVRDTYLHVEIEVCLGFKDGHLTWPGPTVPWKALHLLDRKLDGDWDVFFKPNLAFNSFWAVAHNAEWFKDETYRQAWFKKTAPNTSHDQTEHHSARVDGTGRNDVRYVKMAQATSREVHGVVMAVDDPTALSDMVHRMTQSPNARVVQGPIHPGGGAHLWQPVTTLSKWDPRRDWHGETTHR